MFLKGCALCLSVFRYLKICVCFNVRFYKDVRKAKYETLPNFKKNTTDPAGVS